MRVDIGIKSNKCTFFAFFEAVVVLFFCDLFIIRLHHNFLAQKRNIYIYQYLCVCFAETNMIRVALLYLTNTQHISAKYSSNLSFRIPSPGPSFDLPYPSLSPFRFPFPPSPSDLTTSPLPQLISAL